MINEDSSGTLVLLKNEIKKLKRDLTEQMKHVSVLENEKMLLGESINAEITMKKGQLCKNCQKEIPFEDDELLD